MYRYMDAETRLILIRLAEDFAEGVKTGRLDFTEAQGKRIMNTVQRVLNPQTPLHICNITQACDYLHISQPTFRKYVREGKIAEGKKIAGFTELIWDKKEIERFDKVELSKRRNIAK